MYDAEGQVKCWSLMYERDKWQIPEFKKNNFLVD